MKNYFGLSIEEKAALAKQKQFVPEHFKDAVSESTPVISVESTTTLAPVAETTSSTTTIAVIVPTTTTSTTTIAVVVSTTTTSTTI